MNITKVTAESIINGYRKCTVDVQSICTDCKKLFVTEVSIGYLADKANEIIERKLSENDFMNFESGGLWFNGYDKKLTQFHMCRECELTAISETIETFYETEDE